ncbi:hypothetical protein [Pararhizobium sp. BT-229]|uniref:hypothetical protein n=1 Tax=Pararhizobium sp. BT-229 TaxID=2986923 RepID=UPI0035566E33
MRFSKVARHPIADQPSAAAISVLWGGKSYFLWLIPPLIAAGLWPATGRAHDAPSGWSYPFSCCSNQDCRPVATRAISEKPQGYVINVTGEVVPYADTRVRSSPDGEFHWCSVAGEARSRTLCLFVPPRSF